MYENNILRLHRELCLVITILPDHRLQAQMMEPFVHQGEVGFSVGAGHYFGDLNPNTALNRPKWRPGYFSANR
jgi:hypothetical protein